ncbi:hypothetical protein GCM10011581_02760 [Saccharopolyspora subtropica]|uniref:Uncharacterized protein n=1 Tax=Saccharopolyspora thermophila TaxID=89367 RepID=A0A917N822_9PSEU|nr:hypothetical protein GCM10011581_02760 [Saccharopolyspora subtropica]
MVRISTQHPRNPTAQTMRTREPTPSSWPEHSRPADWTVLVLALAAIGAGLVLGHALLFAGGLILAISVRHLIRWPHSLARRHVPRSKP